MFEKTNPKLLLVCVLFISMRTCFHNLETDIMNLVGGLGDVAGALPKALARRGHRVMVMSSSF